MTVEQTVSFVWSAANVQIRRQGELLDFASHPCLPPTVLVAEVVAMAVKKVVVVVVVEVALEEVVVIGVVAETASELVTLTTKLRSSI